MRSREIESKFRIESYAEAKGVLKELYPNAHTVLVADTIDDYWKVSGKADFVRLRHSWGVTSEGLKRKLKEITVKRKDKGNNLDRLELNLEIGSIEVARAILNLSHGSSLARIEKHELVYFLGDVDNTVLSVCRIGREVYFEVEAYTQATVDSHVQRIGRSLQLRPEPSSLFEIYISKELSNVS